MKKNVVEIDAGRIEKVELGQLAVSPFNVRKNVEVKLDDELVASIRAHGLLQPLVGYIAKSGTALVLICAGQRRLLALRHVAKPDIKIPVRIVDEETAIEVSLAENLERKNMNPVDEFAAFKALVDTGHYDADRIAARFGYNLNLVKRRLKMALLIPEILEAVREGEITIEAAEAYAAGSEEVQRDVFKKHNAKGAWEPHKPERVRGDIVLHGLSASSKVGKFIGGLEAYRAAGGTVIDDAFLDLFKKDDDDGRMRDVSIVRQLVEQRQAAVADDVNAMVKAKYPFASGYEWANLFGTYNVDYPKPSKKSGLVLVGNGWNSEAGDTTKRAKKAANDHDGCVKAIISIDDKGQPEIWAGKFLISKDAWDKVKPEEKSSGGYREPTPEERAEQARRQKIEGQAVTLAIAAMSHETLSAIVRKKGRVWGYHNGGGGFFDFRLEFNASDLKPFIDEATRIIDAPPVEEPASEDKEAVAA